MNEQKLHDDTEQKLHVGALHIPASAKLQPGDLIRVLGPGSWELIECECVGYTIRTDYGTGTEHDVDRSSCLIHADQEFDQ